MISVGNGGANNRGFRYMQYSCFSILWILANLSPGIFSFHVLTYRLTSSHRNERRVLSATSVSDHQPSPSTAKEKRSHGLVAAGRGGKALVDIHNTTDILQAVFGDDHRGALKYMLKGAASGKIDSVSKEKSELASLILENLNTLQLSPPIVDGKILETKGKTDQAIHSESDSLVHTAQELNIFIELRFDGGSRGNPGLGGAGVELYCAWQVNNATVGGKKLFIQHFLGDAPVTNNQAEYQGVVRGLEAVEEIVKNCQEQSNVEPQNCRLTLLVQGDSKLVVNQLKGEYRCKSENLLPLFSSAESLLQKMAMSTSACDVTFEHIARKYNSVADGLANEAMDNRQNLVSESDEVETLSFSIPGWNERINFGAFVVAQSSGLRKDAHEETMPIEHHDLIVENEAVEVVVDIPEQIEQVDRSEMLHVNVDTIEPQQQDSTAKVIRNEGLLDIFAVVNYFGVSNKGHGGAGVEVICNWLVDKKPGSGRRVLVKTYLGKATKKNQAEYHALINGLEEVAGIVQTCGGNMGSPEKQYCLDLRIHGDSKFVMKQFRGDLQCKSESLMPLYSSACKLLQSLEDGASTSSVTVEHLKRKNNAVAQGLAEQAVTTKLSSVEKLDLVGEDVPVRGTTPSGFAEESCQSMDISSQASTVDSHVLDLPGSYETHAPDDGQRPNEYQNEVHDSVEPDSVFLNVEDESNVKKRSPKGGSIHKHEMQRAGNDKTLDIYLDVSFDGGSRGNPGLGGAGAEVNFVWSLDGEIGGQQKVEIGTFLGDDVTNNEADYHGLVRGLEEVIQVVKNYQESLTVPEKNVQLHLSIHGKSKLIIQQLKGEYQCKSERLVPLFSSAKSLLDRIGKCGSALNLTIDHVKRIQNGAAAALAVEAMDQRESWVAKTDNLNPKVSLPIAFAQR